MTVRAMIDINDLIASGRLPVLAATLKVDLGNAVLALSFLYSATQNEKLAEVTQLQARLLVRPKLLAYCPLVDVERLLPAMVEAGLARESSDGVWEIVGNQKRIDELSRHHNFKVDAGSKGGRASGKSRRSKNADREIDAIIEESKDEKTEQNREAERSKPKQTEAKRSAIAIAIAMAKEDPDRTSLASAAELENPSPPEPPARPGETPASRGILDEFLGKAGCSRLEGATHDVQRAWIEAFGVDLVGKELGKANAWILANPKKKPKKFERFFTNWMNRAHEDWRKQYPSQRAPPGDDSANRSAARKALAEDNARRMRENEAIRADPEAAAAAVRKIMANL